MSATTETPSFTRPLTVEELAEILQYNRESVRRAIRQGRIKTILIGRSHRIPADEVARILNDGLPSTR